MKRLFILILMLALAPVTGWAQRVHQKPAASAPVTPAAAPEVAAAPVASSMHDRIAAVVNDNAITTNDINERMKLALLSSGLPPTPEVEHQLLPQILRSLIDEQLQLQEAKRLDITVSKEDIEKAMQRIAHDNNIPAGDLRDYTRDHGASPEALEQQIRGGISWSKVVQRELRPRVEVGDDEVDAVIENMRANAGKEEFLVNEIFLSVDNPKDEDQVKKVADGLVQQIKGGANFAAVARQFSQGTGAASGGDIGWIQEGQLPPELNRALVDLKKGDLSQPIRSSSGFHILGLRDKRTMAVGDSDQDVTLDLQQVFRPFDANTDRAAVAQDAEKLRADINNCSNLENQLAQKFSGWHWQSLGTVKQSKIPAWLGDKVRNAAVGKGSEPIVTDKGDLIVFVCDRHVPEGKVDRDAILNSIGTEKLELQARRLMRDLRRAAYLDIRLGSNS